MAELGETVRLVELICARLCHDLGGLIGTVGNALDMLSEDAANSGDEVLAFANSANKALTQRLRLMRTAWGPEVETLTLPALLRMTTPPLSVRRIGVDSRALPSDCVFSAPMARVLLNLILLAGDCLPKGGTIVLLGEPADLLLRIDGPGAAWPPGFVACMRDPVTALAELTGSRGVQMPLTALFAISGKLPLSPVLGPAGGIEAVRMGPV